MKLTEAISGLNSVAWSSDEVKSLFVNQNSSSPTSSPSGSPGASAGIPPPSQGSSNRIPIIAGSIGGGVALVTIVIGILLWAYRRKKKRTTPVIVATTQEPKFPAWEKSELAETAARQELDSVERLKEAAIPSQPVELEALWIVRR